MTLSQPSDLFERDQEWQDLCQFVTNPGTGLSVAIVYGRRRQGKSYLLRRLATATGGFYHQALEHEPEQALTELGSTFGSHNGVGRLAFSNWSDAIARLARGSVDSKRDSGGELTQGFATQDPTPSVVILDEFPYFIEKSPELPSVIQRIVDQSKNEHWPPVRLILCGSALSTMTSILAGQNPLRGRVKSQILIKPFDYRQAARFWGISDPKLGFYVHTVLGGTPGYRDLVRDVPETLDNFDEWIVREILNPASAFFREDEWLLGEEPTLKDKALYNSVLSAVATGNSTPSQIAASIGREQKNLQHPLDALVRTGFLDKEDDLLRQRRPKYRIVEPIIRFHQAIRNPDLARYEERQGLPAWHDAQRRFETLILGPHFEKIAREYVSKFARSRFSSNDIADEQIGRIGTAVLTDRHNRARHELDIVALGRNSGLRKKTVLLIGETKLRKLNGSDLHRLQHIREQLKQIPNIKSVSTKLLLCSLEGFDESLVTQSRDCNDIFLSGLSHFYHKSD